MKWIVVWLVLFNGQLVVVGDTEHEWATKTECETRLVSETPDFVATMRILAARQQAEFEYINGGCIIPGQPA